MNLFCVSDDPISAAKQLCNAHVIKMCSETRQMLSMPFFPLNKKGKTVAYYMHPASVWIRQTKENMEWAVLHGIALCEEYQRRYKRRHAAHDFMDWVIGNLSRVAFPDCGQTPFARCFSEFKEQLDTETPDTVEAYRRFYWLDKREFAKWPEVSAIPDWWPQKTAEFVDKSFRDGIYTKR